MQRSVLALLVALTAGAANAGFSAVPEPGVMELLALGAVVAVIVGIRKRGKK